MQFRSRKWALLVRAEGYVLIALLAAWRTSRNQFECKGSFTIIYDRIASIRSHRMVSRRHQTLGDNNRKGTLDHIKRQQHENCMITFELYTCPPCSACLMFFNILFACSVTLFCCFRAGYPFLTWVWNGYLCPTPQSIKSTMLQYGDNQCSRFVYACSYTSDFVCIHVDDTLKSV